MYVTVASPHPQDRCVTLVPCARGGRMTEQAIDPAQCKRAQSGWSIDSGRSVTNRDLGQNSVKQRPIQHFWWLNQASTRFCTTLKFESATAFQSVFW